MDKTPYKDLNSFEKKFQLEQLSKGEIYPVTIVNDRYSGTYSGAEWLAIQCDNTQVPDEIGSSDPDEMMFWRNHKDSELPIGKGDTPNQALADLIEKAKQYYSSW